VVTDSRAIITVIFLLGANVSCSSRAPILTVDIVPLVQRLPVDEDEILEPIPCGKAIIRRGLVGEDVWPEHPGRYRLIMGQRNEIDYWVDPGETNRPVVGERITVTGVLECTFTLDLDGRCTGDMFLIERDRKILNLTENKR
jgi:hypothetical protein